MPRAGRTRTYSSHHHHHSVTLVITRRNRRTHVRVDGMDTAEQGKSWRIKVLAKYGCSAPRPDLLAASTRLSFNNALAAFVHHAADI